MPKLKRASFILTTLVMIMSMVTGCGNQSSEESSGYVDPTYNPFGKYEEPIKIKGVMEYLAHNDSRVPSNITPDNQKFIKVNMKTNYQAQCYLENILIF